jgi:L-rhamnose mutarotase
MKKSLHSIFIAIAASAFLLSACRQGKASVSSGENLTERVFVVDIVKDEQKLKQYLDYHQKVWPEVEAGFKKAGYKKIALYRYDHLLVMTIQVPANADLGVMGKLAESYSPRCAEWNKLMDGYQQGVQGTVPGQKWVEAKSFYQFSN